MSRVTTSRSNTAGGTIKNDRLPALAADLVSRRVTVIFANPALRVAAVKAVTDTISDHLHDR